MHSRDSEAVCRNLREVFEALSGDLDATFRRLEGAFDSPDDTGNYTFEQSDARSYVTAAFACIQGICFCMRHTSLASLQTEGAMSDLPTTAQSVGTLEEDIRLAFDLLDRVCEAEPRLDTAMSWWSSLQTSIRLWDRLSNPVTVSDVQISPADLVTVTDSEAGFRLLVSTYWESLD
jgi:hypothetical protein